LNNERIADFFIDQGLMDREQADDVLLETTQNGKDIEQAMVDHGIVDEQQFYLAIADALGTEVIDLEAIEFSPQILRLIPAGLARHWATREVLPNPAGAPTSTSLAAPAVTSRWTSASRGTHSARAAGGCSFVSTVTSTPVPGSAGSATARSARPGRRFCGAYAPPGTCSLSAGMPRPAQCRWS